MIYEAMVQSDESLTGVWVAGLAGEHQEFVTAYPGLQDIDVHPSGHRAVVRVFGGITYPAPETSTDDGGVYRPPGSFLELYDWVLPRMDGE